MNSSSDRQSGAPGASEYAPGQMKKDDSNPSNSAKQYAPGQRMNNPTTGSGSSTTRGTNSR